MAHTPESLPPLPFAAADDAVELVRRYPDYARSLLAIGRRLGTRWGMRAGDAIAHRWLVKAENPYRSELEAIASLLQEEGVYALNYSYEWLCTTGVAADPKGGMRMVRVLDWRMGGLGRLCVLARQKGKAGSYINVTWPGFVGVLTGMAPGRFCAAINQAPIRSRGKLPPVLTLPFDWASARRKVWESRALPPAHLLRRVFDECRSYEEAKRALMETPLCIPALFCLSGTEAGEGCVIERTEHDCAVREAPAVIANHWESLPLRGKPRGHHSGQRHAVLMECLRERRVPEPAALPFPVLNETTRLVVMANAARGELTAQGWERTGAVTAATSLTA